MLLRVLEHLRAADGPQDSFPFKAVTERSFLQAPVLGQLWTAHISCTSASISLSCVDDWQISVGASTSIILGCPKLTPSPPPSSQWELLLQVQKWNHLWKLPRICFMSREPSKSEVNNSVWTTATKCAEIVLRSLCNIQAAIKSCNQYASGNGQEQVLVLFSRQFLSEWRWHVNSCRRSHYTFLPASCKIISWPNPVWHPSVGTE